MLVDPDRALDLSPILADPPAMISMVPGSIQSAVDWLQGTLLGTVATVTAVIAVASLGFLMLSGRIDVPRALRVVFGCFILFGASSIAGAIIAGVHGDPSLEAAQSGDQALLSSAPQYPETKADAFDPYAGAALMPRE